MSRRFKKHYKIEEARALLPQIRIWLKDIQEHRARLQKIDSRLGQLLEGGAGIITRLENKVAGLPDYEAQLRQTIAEKQSVLADVESQAGKPFKYEDKLVATRAKSAELDEKLKASIEPPKPAPEQGAPAAEQEVAPDVARMRRLQAASFPASPGSTRPPQTHPSPEGPTSHIYDRSRNNSFER